MQQALDLNAVVIDLEENAAAALSGEDINLATALEPGLRPGPGGSQPDRASIAQPGRQCPRRPCRGRAKLTIATLRNVKLDEGHDAQTHVQKLKPGRYVLLLG